MILLAKIVGPLLLAAAVAVAMYAKDRGLL